MVDLLKVREKLKVSVKNYLYRTVFVIAHENLADTIVEGELEYTFVRHPNSLLFYVLYRVDITSAINLLITALVHAYLLSFYDMDL